MDTGVFHLYFQKILKIFVIKNYLFLYYLPKNSLQLFLLIYLLDSYFNFYFKSYYLFIRNLDQIKISMKFKLWKNRKKIFIYWILWIWTRGLVWTIIFTFNSILSLLLIVLKLWKMLLLRKVLSWTRLSSIYLGRVFRNSVKLFRIQT